MRKNVSWLCAASSLAVLVMGGGAAQADHRWANSPLVALSEEVRCQTDELRDSFRDQFRQSAVYHELMWKSHELKNSAARLRALARSNGCSIRMRNEMETMECAIADMVSLVEVARLRAARGLDRPLCGCTRHIDAKLGRLRYTVLTMHRYLGGSRGWYPYDGSHWHGDYGYGREAYRHSVYGHEPSREDWIDTLWHVDPGFAIQGPRGRAGIEFETDGGIVLNIGGTGVRIR